jgi:hypothetical protein
MILEESHKSNNSQKSEISADNFRGNRCLNILLFQVFSEKILILPNIS